MNEFLARSLIRWRWAVIVLWAVIGAVAANRAPRVLEVLNVQGGTDQETETSRTEAMIRTRFARPASDLLAVTFAAPDPVDSGSARVMLDSMVAALGREPFITGLIYYRPGEDSLYELHEGRTTFRAAGDSALVSQDHRSTFIVLTLAAVPNSQHPGIIRSLRTVIHRTLAAAGPEGDRYEVLLTGRAPLDYDIRAISARDSKEAELRLLPLTMVVLVLAFGAFVSALLPLVVGFLAIWITLAVITVLADYTPMSIFVLNMTSMLGLGVGIDYSLLIVTRFREELNRGLRRREAARRTLSTAGAAVLTSGLTVVVGFAALLLTPLVETRSVGLGGLVVVSVAVLLSTTLLPSLLAVLGRQIDRPRWLARMLAWYHAPTVWEKWARSLGRHPRRALLVGGSTIAILSAPAFLIRIGLPARNWFPAQTEAGRAIEALQQMGAASVILPVRVVIEFPPGQAAVSATSLRGLRALSDSFRHDPRVDRVRSLVDLKRGTSILGYSLLYSDLPAARQEYGDFLDAYLSQDGRLALMDVILADSVSLPTSMDVSRRARELGTLDIKGLKGAKVSVGGYTASALDVQTLLLKVFPRLVVLILGVTGLMLAFAFRSVLVPIKAVIMNSLSVSATFGLIVLVFQYGLGAQFFGLAGPTSAIFVVIPVMVFCVVFGLSMDYEVFLLSRVKEAFDRTGDNDRATQDGLSATASTITSAALIMILVFGVFAFARVLVMQFLGFGLAAAVLLDATIIRMVLVPAIMHLAGRWNWWPGVRKAAAEGS